MTKTYNRFHDPYENDSDISKLRELHAAMDRAILDAYGWTDIPTDCDFLLDYEIDEATWAGRRSRTATAGRTPSVTRCSPASSPSTPNARPRKPAQAPSHQRDATRPEVGGFQRYTQGNSVGTGHSRPGVNGVSLYPCSRLLVHVFCSAISGGTVSGSRFRARRRWRSA